MDGDAKMVETILTKMFSYKDPEEFKENAEYVKPRVTGSFPAYWYKGGIEANYKELKLQAQGRKNERFVKKMTITKYAEGHYYAKAESGVLTGTTKESNIEPDEYGLEIKKRNGKWAIERIKGLESMNNNGN